VPLLERAASTDQKIAATVINASIRQGDSELRGRARLANLLAQPTHMVLELGVTTRCAALPIEQHGEPDADDEVRAGRRRQGVDVRRQVARQNWR
jgi:hypothetical protein